MAWRSSWNSDKVLFDTCRLWNLLWWPLHVNEEDFWGWNESRTLSCSGKTVCKMKPVSWIPMYLNLTLHELDYATHRVDNAKSLCWCWGKHKESTGIESAQFMRVQGLWWETPPQVLCWVDNCTLNSSMQPKQIKYNHLRQIPSWLVYAWELGNKINSFSLRSPWNSF